MGPPDSGGPFLCAWLDGLKTQKPLSRRKWGRLDSVWRKQLFGLRESSNGMTTKNNGISRAIGGLRWVVELAQRLVNFFVGLVGGREREEVHQSGAAGSPIRDDSETVGIPPELMKRIRQIEVRTRRLVSDSFAGQYYSAFKGQGMDFDEVREYQPGDDVRSIDWNVTARMNHPFVKTFREERELTVILMVDLSGSGRFGSGDMSKRELMAEVAAVLAFSAIRNQDKVGLLLFSEIVERYVPPAKGRRHVLRVVRMSFFIALFIRAPTPMELWSSFGGCCRIVQS